MAIFSAPGLGVRSLALVASAMLLAGLIACGAKDDPLLPDSQAPQTAPSHQRQQHPLTAQVSVTPSSLVLLGIGSESVQTVTVAETGYSGAFTESGTCSGFVTASPTSGNGPSLKVKLTAVKAGKCAFTFADSAANKATLQISVTTTSVFVTGPSISQGAKSVYIALSSVNGAPPPAGIVTVVHVNLPACSTGCTFAGPQTPAGNDVFAVRTYDTLVGTAGKTLAIASITKTITAGAANSVTASLNKVVSSLVIGNAPAGTAGTAFTGKTIVLTAEDPDGNAIVGNSTFS